MLIATPNPLGLMALALTTFAACGSDSKSGPDGGLQSYDGSLVAFDAAPEDDAPNIDAGPVLPVTVQVATSARHTCVLSSTGKVKCFGESDSTYPLGYLDGLDRGDESGEMGDALPTVDLGTSHLAVQIALGFRSSCALLDDSSVKCWGDNTSGHLGLGNLSFIDMMGDDLATVDVGPGRTAKQIAMGGSHTCAILDTDQIKCWGSNSYGQLGLGDRVSRGSLTDQMGANLPTVPLGTGRSATALFMGDQSSCALLDNAALKCWGRNDWGQLASGDSLRRGENPGEMGDALVAINFGSGRTVVNVAVGTQHACAVLDNGEVKCWGNNVSGELGMGPSGDWGDDPAELGDAWPSVPLGSGRMATAVAAGENHSFAVLDNDEVKCWGYNAYGNLGLEDDESRSGLAELGDALPAINFGTGRSVKALTSKVQYTCALLDNDALKCWGRGNRDLQFGGWLGLGDLEHRGNDVGEMGDALPAIELW